MSKPVIICVDDERIVLDSLKEQLNSKFGYDYHIEITENSEEAMRLFQELTHENTEIPLIITDYLMPGMKGDELLKCLCEIDPKVVSVLLTGQATIEGVANAVNYAGVFKYIAKPWSMEELYSIVDEALTHYYEERLYQDKVVKLKIINAELKQTLANKAKELEQNRGFMETNAAAVGSEQPSSIVSRRLSKLLSTIKSGIDIIHTQKTNLPGPETGNPPLDIQSINEFYQITSDVLGNLGEMLGSEAPNYPAQSFDGNVYKIVADKISAISQHLSGNIQELTNRVNSMEQKFTGSIERIAAWDEEEIIVVDLNEVLFFTSQDSQTYVTTPKAKYKIRDTLDILETKLCRRNFFRCHRSFIVNLKHIIKISPWFGNNSYIAKFGDCEYEVPISRNRIKDMKGLLEIG